MNRALLAVVALLLAARVPPAAAQDIGRLFFTPEQRDALDARRKARVPDKPSAPVVESPTTRIDGYVQRSGGLSTVWVNGQAVPQGSQPEGMRVTPERDPTRVELSVGDGEQKIPLRVGDVLDRGTGEVHHVIGNGKVEVEGPPRPAR